MTTPSSSSNTARDLGPPPPGYNALISWSSSEGETFSIPVRVKAVGHNFEVIYDESYGRLSRGFYPKARAIGRFALTMEFVGYNAYREFLRYMTNYIHVFLDTHSNRPPTMTIDIQASRVFPLEGGFLRRAIPISGLADEDAVGKIVYSPTVVFESLDDPLDPAVWWDENWNSHISIFDVVHYEDKVIKANEEARFWYPNAPGTNDPNARGNTPEGLYDGPPQAPSPPPLPLPSASPTPPPPGPPTVPPATPGNWFTDIVSGIGDIFR